MPADNPSVCVLPVLSGTGGPSSFLSKLKIGLKSRGIEVHHNIRQPGTKALLVIGGTRRVGDLIFAKTRGIRIIQRLDGINWLHKKVRTGAKHYLRSEWMNLILSVIRLRFADGIVYQSAFTQGWWNKKFGAALVPGTVIHNGVDLDLFSPGPITEKDKSRIKLLVIEGSFEGGHARDLQNAVALANGIAEGSEKPVDLFIAGKVPQAYIKDLAIDRRVTAHWLGLIPHADIPDLNRSAHLIFPAEINAACPNSLIEALACGLPAVGYATGSIPELIGSDGGIVVPYGADHWNLLPPVSAPLTEAALKILANQEGFSASARKRAEKRFSLDLMVEKYHTVLFGDLTQLNG